MYAGHAAVALLAKGIRPSVPIAVLVPAAFGPDWLQWFLALAGRQNRMLSHSLVSLVFCASLVALVYWAITRSRIDAGVVWLTYFSHWPADFITGTKPTWPGGPDVGLGVYGDPVADIAGESAVVILCYIVYRRSLPPANRNRPLGLLVPLGLIAMQIGFHAIQKPEVKEPLRQIIGDTRAPTRCAGGTISLQRSARRSAACLLQRSLGNSTRADHGE